jgi:hypothetical protein
MKSQEPFLSVAEPLPRGEVEPEDKVSTNFSALAKETEPLFKSFAEQVARYYIRADSSGIDEYCNDSGGVTTLE